MADPRTSPIPSFSKPPLRLDSTTLVRRSLDMSPRRSSVQSSGTYTPSSSVPSTPVTSAREQSPERKPLHFGDSNAFLTALAAQERRVLELKEELQKAEVELHNLKKQWASQEAAKKKNELLQLEQLQPLKSSSGGPGSAGDNESKSASRDLDRRKMAPPPNKSSQRTIFSGSRHARTLSLLSPKDSMTQSTLSLHNQGLPQRNHDRMNDSAIPTTIEELGNATDGLNESNGHYSELPKDMILETGKQLVGEFRQGLWTFFEDLKQVTVGDDAANTSKPRFPQDTSLSSMSKTQQKREKGAVNKNCITRNDIHPGGDTTGKSVQMEPLTIRDLTQVSTEKRSSTPLIAPSISSEHGSRLNTINTSSESDGDDGCTCSNILHYSKLDHSTYILRHVS